MNQRKPLKELNLLDKFLFDEAMDDPENVKTMLDIITESEYKSETSTDKQKKNREHLRITGRSGWMSML
mgnify:CR=1 FL=1